MAAIVLFDNSCLTIVAGLSCTKVMLVIYAVHAVASVVSRN